MNSLDLNFLRRRRLVSMPGLVLFALGAAALSVVGMDYRAARAELNRVELGLAAPRKSDATAAQRDLALPAATDEKQAVERVRAQLNTPWDVVLREIATRAGPSVALLELEAQGQTRSLRITGEAKTMSDVVAFVGRLRESKIIETANLSRHEEVMSASVKVIRFSLDANWKNAS